MFTSEPSLAQRIERMIAETPIIDPHSRIRCDEPGTPDLASLMSDPAVQSELRAVGMPAADFDPALPADERVRRSIPYLRRMRNTSSAWCLYRIFRDLYDFGDRHLTESNYRDLMDRVAANAQDPGWASNVLRDRCNIRTVVTSLGNRSADPAKNPDHVLFLLDVHDLFCPGVATEMTPFAGVRTSKREYYEMLCSRFGERLTSHSRLERLIHDWLDRTVTGPVRFSSTFLPIEQRFLAPDDSQVHFVLSQAATGHELSGGDVETLVRFVTWHVLGWHHENEKAFQIAVGAESCLGDGTSLPRFQEHWTSEMSRAFHQFRAARFDLLTASDVLTHEVAVLMGQLPNVYGTGDWRHNAVPSTIERSFGLRVQAAPMTKIGGFLSDARYAEWTYGKLQVVKKALAAALARLVDAGYSEEHELPELLQQVLHDTPRDLYDLGPRALPTSPPSSTSPSGS